MPVWNQLSLQDSVSVNMFMVSCLHDHVMMVVISIVCIVLYVISFISVNILTNRFFYKNELLELIWTLIPGLMIVGMAMPSLYSLYMMEESFSPMITFKAIGHQWYWSYELSDFDEVSFESYLVSDTNKEASFRLLEVDNNIVIPFKTEIRLITTSTDVIHSWTIPSLGVKIDSVPGRLNQSYFMFVRSGIVYGQCSEICGALHSFMPICMESVSNKSFLKWVLSFYS